MAHHIFGIRHHGPGSARSLLATGKSLEAQKEFRAIRSVLANWPATAKDRQTMNLVDAWARLGVAEAAYEAKDFEAALGFLMAWPALADAARMITTRAEEAAVDPDAAELWAGKLRARHAAAALILLRKSAAAAFRRRELATAERLTLEADSIDAGA